MTIYKEIAHNLWERQMMLCDLNETTGAITYLGNPRFEPIYETVYGYNSEHWTENGIIVHKIVFDFDNVIVDHARTDTQMFLMSLESNYELSVNNDLDIYFSGAKGFHIEIPIKILTGNPVSTEMNDEDIKRFCTSIAGMFESFDSRIYNKRRLFRLKNAINASTNIKKTLIGYDTLSSNMNNIMNVCYDKDIPDAIPVCSLQDVLDRNNLLYQHYLTCQQIQKRERATLQFTDYFQPAKRGNRNNAAAALAGLIYGKTVDADILTQIIYMWNRTLSEPLPNREIEQTIKSIIKRRTTT